MKSPQSGQRMRFPPTLVAAAALVALLLLPAGGCGPGVSDAELGRQVFHLPELPGTDTPYALPILDGLDTGPSADNPESPAKTGVPVAPPTP